MTIRPQEGNKQAGSPSDSEVPETIYGAVLIGKSRSNIQRPHIAMRGYGSAKKSTPPENWAWHIRENS